MKRPPLVPALSTVVICAVLSLSSLLSLPAAADDTAGGSGAKPPAAPPPGSLRVDMGKLKGTAGGGLTQAKLVDQASSVARGYYDALIAGNFEQAVSFLHPSEVEPIRAQIVSSLEAATDGQKKATLTSLGVADLNTLRTMPPEKFFVTWARSPLGQGVQLLSSDKIAQIRVVLDPPRCDLPTKTCDVRVTLRGDTTDGKKIEKPNAVVIVYEDGRYLLTQPVQPAPPAKKPAAQN